MTLPPAAPLSSHRLDRIDRFLESTVGEAFKHDERLHGLDVQVSVRGGVAHLTGAVDRPEQLALVRDLVGRFQGVLAVWDRVVVDGHRPVVLDVGCGGTKQYPDNIGVDRRAATGVDVVADLRDGLPFPDGCADRVFAVHVLEHLVDFLPLVDECHRVLRPGGILHVLSPWWRYVNAVADPTHVRFLDVQTFKGICERQDTDRRWFPLHAECDGASVFADLLRVDGDAPAPSAEHLARFFD
ncbi:BON domain-containing protein [Amycolatopsis arida]|uniref:BON domain-containing protein n=1 Tax=Amycolatopsis arida TaxID=587909 RepID=A0A1I5YXR1_9PSEU|nr:methyltransferase domain-containing protein [Amycolatopsis arida]TDX89943.1 BON domain-containing protein [Amycolatopsis arida]SFQ48617.1 BON domain-containing protein [Amycolatopsis arida]